MVSDGAVLEKECRRYREKLSLYIDGELGPDDVAELLRHAQTCRRCASAMSAYADMTCDLGRLPRALPDLTFHNETMAKVKNLQNSDPRRTWQNPRPGYRVRGMAGAVAAMAVFVLFVSMVSVRVDYARNIEISVVSDVVLDFAADYPAEFIDDLDIAARRRDVAVEQHWSGPPAGIQPFGAQSVGGGLEVGDFARAGAVAPSFAVTDAPEPPAAPSIAPSIAMEAAAADADMFALEMPAPVMAAPEAATPAAPEIEVASEIEAAPEIEVAPEIEDTPEIEDAPGNPSLETAERGVVAFLMNILRYILFIGGTVLIGWITFTTLTRKFGRR